MYAYVFYHTISTAWISFLWWNLLSVIYHYWLLNFLLVCISSCKHVLLLIDTSLFFREWYILKNFNVRDIWKDIK